MLGTGGKQTRLLTVTLKSVKGSMSRKHLIKILGLSLLAAVGIMAVSASAAHAKWLMLRNGASVLSLELEVSLPLGILLIPGLGTELHCAGGEGGIAGSLSGDHKTLTGLAETTFSGCIDPIWNEVCAVGSPGEPNGKIAASANLVAGMGEGQEEYFFNMTSSQFAKAEYRGEECPLTEINARVGGNARVDLLNALADTTLKVGHFLSTGMTLWGGSATAHDGEGEILPISIEEVSGATWSLHLVNL